MAQFRSLSAGDVQDILRGFGVGGYRAHQPIAVGTVNTNVRVETDTGLLFLRVNEGKSEDDVRREAAIVAHAAVHGVPTPAPRVAAGGAPFADWRGERVSLFPWVAGRTLARARADARARRGGRRGAGPVAPGERRLRRPPPRPLRAR